MLVLMIFLWTIAGILIITDPRTESTRWVSAIAFFSGLGGLAVVLRENIIPYFELSITKNPIIVNKLQFLSGFSASLSHYVAPYTLLVYGIIFSNIFKEAWKKQRIKVISVLFIPPALMYILFPVYPVFMTSYPILSIWVAPYVLIANFLLIYSLLKTRGTMIRHQKLLTCTIITPGTLMSMVTNYLFPAFGIKGVYVYNTWIIILQFIMFLFFSFKQGALGVKLTFEKQSLDRTLKALTSGTIILNHTIKNEVVKISMCMNNIKSSTANVVQNTPEMADVNENIGVVNDSINYLVVMINKIQSQVKDIILEEHQNNLGNIIDKAVNMVVPYTKDKNINIVKNYNYYFSMLCDGVHLQEIFINILNNAIEAIRSGGEIRIDIYENKKFVTIAVKDNGPGISKENLPHVIDPFFSTKHRSKNFGLGLSYCYNVMQQHGGGLEIQSEEGIGTTVLLNFPIKRLSRKKLIHESIGVDCS